MKDLSWLDFLKQSDNTREVVKVAFVDFYLVFNEDRTVGNSNVTPDLPNFNSRIIVCETANTSVTKVCITN